MVSKIILETPPTKEVNLTWGQNDSTFKIVDTELPDVKDGELRIKALYLSNDPTQRLWISAGQDPKRQYMPPILKGDAIRTLGLGEVLESKSDKYVKGDVISGVFHWGDEIIIPEASVSAKVDKSLPYEWYLSAIGLTGLTAYFGLQKVGQFKEGQTVLVSAASGATGSMVVQLAKHFFKASKVVGIAGSDEKCKWVESLGADLCVNYRDADYKKKIDDFIGDEHFDVYFDNVGGDMLDYALKRTKRYGRIIACGAISGYNDVSKMDVSAWVEIISNRLTVQGFIVFDFFSEFPQAVEDIVAVIKSGKVTVEEGVHIEDVSKFENPLEKVPEVWFKLFSEDKPRGKLLTKLV
ncbi:NAD(P)-binding protein [Metschnikowia bicuspidata var. bicuspidata NRRL YB-4993]|uniref:NAD(P)-binding protein n=1 Tax=Metschnikowia bicuspidata var. bicuspidata NRRL YB-4993 TaxID=869754 RepID=A0A1A0H1R2_9ASCO|nr:NAD(P)-binding protein [Metschnikowia bicuspidata var. bicuspidata NRRL YB-4993]OBA17969.1 NAD(P)-binding protein [Metschnikowia bicuspidata var. bicuspidata NRRL YB-4993]